MTTGPAPTCTSIPIDTQSLTSDGGFAWPEPTSTVTIDTVSGPRAVDVVRPAKTVDGFKVPKQARGLAVVDARPIAGPDAGDRVFTVTHVASGTCLGVFTTQHAAQAFARDPLIRSIDWSVSAAVLRGRITRDIWAVLDTVRREHGGFPGPRRAVTSAGDSE